ncbi:hypothetical protein N8T08_001676 [Aspergillus melleus]|uniref:Uncharacterized protein n=1 Tax=Aspergillus melleus TaxID=138277 RepID=A0ACC3AMY6_9EURO|nr:hypothetical protein N8T08_001676 [Aspergillus melleus]
MSAVTNLTIHSQTASPDGSPVWGVIYPTFDGGVLDLVRSSWRKLGGNRFLDGLVPN